MTRAATLSMTGYASRVGAGDPFQWVWEIRSVNGRGLEIKPRLPDWIPGLDQAVRQALQKALGRGNVSVSLKLSRLAGAPAAGLDRDALAGVLSSLREIETAAAEADLGLSPSTAADVAAMPGVLVAGAEVSDPEAVKAAVMADFPHLLSAFQDSRAAEGQALERVIADQVDRIDALTTAAAACTEARAEAQAARLRDKLAQVLDAADGIDSARVAQELALIAVKSDITEELDRLRAHVEAARGLLAAEGPKGRKLDFLTQEFNREANTLCSKAGSTELTAIGLELKTVIDQMREQVQNVE